jgi:hypothetical protein
VGLKTPCETDSPNGPVRPRHSTWVAAPLI